MAEIEAEMRTVMGRSKNGRASQQLYYQQAANSEQDIRSTRRAIHSIQADTVSQAGGGRQPLVNCCGQTRVMWFFFSRFFRLFRAVKASSGAGKQAHQGFGCR